jgi:hypothetical protein
VCVANMSGAAGLGSAVGPMIHRLSPWMPLITAPEAVVGQFLGSVSPSTWMDRCGRHTSVSCDVPPTLRET